MREKARFLAGFFVEWDKKEIEMPKGYGNIGFIDLE